MEATAQLAAQQARASRYLSLYVGVAVVIAVMAAYVVLGAQLTKSAYQLSVIQQEHQALLSQEGQLEYQDAALHTPARVAQEAQQAGLVQSSPARYVNYQAAGVDLAAPIAPPAVRHLPLWQRLLARLLSFSGHPTLAAALVR